MKFKLRNKIVDIQVDKLFSWQNIRKIAELKYVKTSYTWVFIVPVVVNLFSLVNQKSVNLTIFNHKFNVLLSLPFSWQVFFFASLFFMFSFFVYLWRAPPIIKDHKNWAEFKSKGQTSDHLFNYANQVSSWASSTIKIPDGSTDSIDEQTQKLYWRIMDEADYKNQRSRWTCGLVFLLAFLLLAWLVLENIYTVIKFSINA